MQKSLRFFLTCIVLTVGPYDFYISFWSIRLFTDYVIFIHRVSKKMQVTLCWLFVLLLLLFIRRVLNSSSKYQAPLGFPPAELEDEMQPCLRGGVATPSVLCLPKRNLLPWVGRCCSPCSAWGWLQCREPRKWFRTGSALSGEIPKLAHRKKLRDYVNLSLCLANSEMQESNQYYLWNQLKTCS